MREIAGWIASLRLRGVVLSVRDHRLCVDAPRNVLTASELEEIRSRRNELLEAVRATEDVLSEQAARLKPGDFDAAKLRARAAAAGVHGGRTQIVHGDGRELAAFLADADRAEILRQIAADGSVLFRGFAPLDAAIFRRALAHLIGEFHTSSGEHVPVEQHTEIFHPVGYAPEQRLLWHNENSFNATWPRLIAFGCLVPAATGGETTLADSRAMMHVLDDAVVAEFRRRGVSYVRRLGLGVGRHWRDIFDTTSRSRVEELCAKEGFAFRWRDGDVLETCCVRAATLVRPDDGAECWFNQAQHWHSYCLGVQERAEFQQLLGSDAMPRECLFGDGGRIPDDVMAHILAAYESLERPIRWEAGDVVVLDNLATAHGRNPFTGPRRLLVAMGNAKLALAGTDGV